MFYDPNDTIAAISSAPGGAARGIVRVSGLASFSIVANCFATANNDAKGQNCFPKATCGRVDISLNGASHPIPCDLFVWPHSRSYTHEPVAEFHTVASPPILKALLSRVCRAGARLAEPGEFTLRAFLAGRLDLTQAEAVLGVIDADDARNLNTALHQLAGGLGRPLRQLRDELLQLLAEVEAGLDFVEDDIEFISRKHLQRRLDVVNKEIKVVTAQLSTRLVTNQLPQVVLFGPPNAGKSTLFNALASSATQAIVSPQHGTTRDYLSATLDLGNFKCEIIDTAGIEFDSDNSSIVSIDAEAQTQTDVIRDQAFLRLLCIDAAAPDAEQWLMNARAADLVVVTKSDMAVDRATQFAARIKDTPAIITSAVTGEGLSQLRAVLASTLDSTRAEHSANCVATTSDRCRDSLCLAATAIARAREITAASGGEELVAAELRNALTELGKVVGAVYTDDILDRIFSNFCIGK